MTWGRTTSNQCGIIFAVVEKVYPLWYRTHGFWDETTLYLLIPWGYVLPMWRGLITPVLVSRRVVSCRAMRVTSRPQQARVGRGGAVFARRIVRADPDRQGDAHGAGGRLHGSGHGCCDRRRGELT